MWTRLAAVGLPLTFNKFDWQDFFQGASISMGAIAVAMIFLTLFAALRRKRDSGPGRGPGDAGGNSD